MFFKVNRYALNGKLKGTPLLHQGYWAYVFAAMMSVGLLGYSMWKSWLFFEYGLDALPLGELMASVLAVMVPLCIYAFIRLLAAVLVQFWRERDISIFYSWIGWGLLVVVLLVKLDGRWLVQLIYGLLLVLAIFMEGYAKEVKAWVRSQERQEVREIEMEIRRLKEELEGWRINSLG